MLIIFFGVIMDIVGTMSTTGFITDNVEAALDRHFAYFFAAKNSQSNYLGKTNSIDWVIAKNNGSKGSLVDGMKTALENHFKTVFKTVNVMVSGEGIDSEEDGKIKLKIAIQVIDNGESADLAQSLVVSGETFRFVNEVL